MNNTITNDEKLKIYEYVYKQAKQLKMKYSTEQIKRKYFFVYEYLKQLEIHDTVALFKEITGVHYTGKKTETTDFIIEEIVCTDTNVKQFGQKMKSVFVEDHFPSLLKSSNVISLFKELNGVQFRIITKKEMNKFIYDIISWEGVNDKQVEQLKMKNFADKREEDHRHELLKPNELITLFKELNGKLSDIVLDQKDSSVRKVPNYPKTMLAIVTLGAVCASVFFTIRGNTTTDN